MKKGSLLKRGKLIATVGTIKEFKAVGAKKLQVEFDGAVADKVTRDSLSIKRGNSAVAGNATWNAENTVATFTSNSILTQGKYIASMTGVESKEADVEAEKVADIVINGDKDNILTGTSEEAKKNNRSNDEAYIYYDIVNQYGESIRERTTVNWSITSCDTNRESKSLGLVVARRKGDKEIFIYGTQVSITAVCIKDNVPVTKTKVVTVGEQQAIDEVVFKGFVKKSNKGKKIDEKDVLVDVPADFAKDTWAILYQAKDQHGNLLEAASDNLGGNSAGAKIAMVSGQPTYIENKFEDGGIYSVTSAEDNRTTEYSSATIEPGAYIDRGESIDITAISTRTGKPITQNYKIGPSARLKSFEMEKPAQVVADGDVDVVIPFTALDMDGNPTDNYKTIVRSSNKLSLTASEGTLTLKEDKDGKAVLTWTDADKYTGKNGAPVNPYSNPAITIDDGVDRAVSLTAVVTGEEASSKQTTLSVSDMRRPASIEDVRFGDNDTAIGGNSTTKGDFNYLNPLDVSISNGIAYNDQYGVSFAGGYKDTQRSKFWQAAENGAVGNYLYSISVKQLSDDDKIRMVGSRKASTGSTGSSSSTNDNIGGSGVGNEFIDETNSGSTVTTSSVGDVINLAKAGGVIRHNINPKDWKNPDKRDDVNATIRYSIVERPATSNSSYNEIGKARTESYTVVPITKLSDFTINTISDKLGIETEISGDPNGSFDSGKGSFSYLGGGNANYAITGSALEICTSGLIPNPPFTKVNDVNVTAKYKNSVLRVPFNYIRTTDDYTWNKNSTDTVSGSGILINGNSTVAGATTPGNGYTASISKVNEGAIRWRDLYNVNSARYERIDARTRLEFIIGADVNNDKTTDVKLTHDGTRVSKYITISDAYAEISNMTLNSGALRPTDTKMLIEGTGYVSAVDQYGQNYIGTNYNELYDKYNNVKRSILYTVSAYEENPNGRIEGNLKISNKSDGTVEIEGAELGDSYTLKAEVENTGFSDTKQFKVEDDINAVITSDSDKDKKDYDLRTKYLGYNR